MNIKIMNMQRENLLDVPSFSEGFDEAIAALSQREREGYLNRNVPVTVVITSNGKFNGNDRRVDVAVFTGASIQQVGENLANS